MKEPLINILIRTCGRPNSFARCMDSIMEQTYTNYKVHVSVDDQYDDLYVEDYGIIPTIVYPGRKGSTPSGEKICHWNLYLNKLMDQVHDGWIFILDDDDYLSHNKALQVIADNIMLYDAETMHVWQMTWPNGRIIPEPEFIGVVPFVRKHIGMPCFTFHFKYKYNRFDDLRAGDFRFINKLSTHVKHINFIETILINIGNTGLVGQKKDIVYEKRRSN